MTSFQAELTSVLDAPELDTATKLEVLRRVVDGRRPLSPAENAAAIEEMFGKAPVPAPTPMGPSEPLPTVAEEVKSLQIAERHRPYTQEEVADKLRKSTKAVKRLELRGFLDRVPGISRPPLYTIDSVEALMAGHRRRKR